MNNPSQPNPIPTTASHPDSRPWLLAALLNTLRGLAPFAIGLALACLLQFIIGPHLGGYYSIVLIAIGINMILAVSLNMVNGYTGQFSIGHAGFMAVGGYTSAAITYYGAFRIFGGAIYKPLIFSGPTLLFLCSLVVGGLFAAIAGYVVGLPSLRLRGDYLAIVTLGFGEIIRVLIQQTDEVNLTPEEIAKAPIIGISTSKEGHIILTGLASHLGGPLGFSGLTCYTNLLWTWIGAAITVIVAYRLKNSSQGRAFLAIRENPVAASAMGVPVTRYKVRAFVVSAFFAGVAGGLFAHNLGNILTPSELGFQRSFEIIIMVVLGGMGSVTGVILAAIGLTILPEMLRSPPHVWPLTIGFLVITLSIGRRPKWKTLAILVGSTAALELIRFEAVKNKIDLGDYRMIIYALMLVIIMLVRPQGLMGIHEIWELIAAWWRNRGKRCQDDLIAATEGGTTHPDTISPLLEITDVSLSFGGLKAVNQFRLSLPSGRIHGLIGPNGAGKTTCFNILTGVYRPQTGSILLDGRSVLGLPPHLIAKAGIARTFQNIRIFGELSVLDNVKVACHLRAGHGLFGTLFRSLKQRRDEAAISARALQLLSIFNLAPRAHEQAKSLSYGDQRRLEIARALATEPKVLLLDEPAAGMNSSEKVALTHLVRDVQRKFNLTILLIDHDVGLIMDICDRITVLDYGQIIAEGTPAEIQSDPRVIEAYLGEPVKAV